MPHVFISYAHVSPDQNVAAELSALLEANGYSVFVDTKIRVGQDWSQQIELQLRNAEYFIVLLSVASIESDMVHRETALAHRLRKAKKLTILPVRLGFEGDLPYDLAAYLDPIQYTIWDPGQPSESMGRTILEAMKEPGRNNAEMPIASEAAASRLASAASAGTAPGTSPRSSPAVPPIGPAEHASPFDQPQLDRVKRELSIYVGPMARLIVDRAARKATNWQQLYDLLSGEIPNSEERKKFLKMRPR